VRFLVDNQLPAALARWISAQGLDCHHVLDLGLAEASDAEIWRYAADQDVVLISKDEDFFHFATRPGSTARLLWVRLGNCRRAGLLSVFEAVWPRIQASLEAGDRVIEVR